MRKIYVYVILYTFFPSIFRLFERSELFLRLNFFSEPKCQRRGAARVIQRGGHASPTRPLEVLSKSVTVRRPPWISCCRPDINNSESLFGKFERYFGGRNASFTALLMLIIFHSLRLSVSFQIAIQPDFFRCDLWLYILYRAAILHIPVKIAFLPL